MSRCFSNKFTIPSYSRKHPEKTRLLRKKLVNCLRTQPDNFTKATYIKSLNCQQRYGTQPPTNPQRFFRSTEQAPRPEHPQEFNNQLTTRDRLAEYLRTDVDTIEWARKRLYALIDGCEELVMSCPVDDYFIWVMSRCINNKFTIPSYSRKHPEKTRLLRKKLVKFLQEYPDNFTKVTYLESLNRQPSQPPMPTSQKFFQPTEQILGPERPQEFN